MPSWCSSHTIKADWLFYLQSGYIPWLHGLLWYWRLIIQDNQFPCVSSSFPYFKMKRGKTQDNHSVVKTTFTVHMSIKLAVHTHTERETLWISPRIYCLAPRHNLAGKHSLRCCSYLPLWHCSIFAHTTYLARDQMQFILLAMRV